MMPKIWFGLAIAAFGMVPAWAQTHAIKKTEDVVRAVAVYEWTGDEGKATASRVVPVSLFIDGQFQDAAIYMARPVPMALDTGTVYEVRKAGVDSGTLELVYERHLTSGDTEEIDDGWLGYGEFKVKPKETLLAKKQSGPLPSLVVGGKAGSDSGPRLVSRSGSTSSTSDAGSSNAGSGGASKSSKTSAPATTNADDADSPTLHRRAGGDQDDSTGAGSTAEKPADAKTASSTNADDDAERPTLKRRTPAEIKSAKKQRDSARVVAGNDLNDDPDRPTLHRGSKTSTPEEEVPPLRGLPKDMKQLVAISDAKDRPEHEFMRRWESEEERAEILGKMQAIARQQLATYKGFVAATPPASSFPVPTKGAAAARLAAKRKAAAGAAQPTAVALNEESLKGYTLSYGGASTYVYSATSPGANGISRYVSLVAQEEPTVGLKLALASVTDSSHLDRTPWMRFVDVVDADASNRASLLMELRAQHTRQFALYRVIGAEADQIFLTGSTE
jgi:hypothetical protein